jgi:hypothetical protein
MTPLSVHTLHLCFFYLPAHNYFIGFHNRDRVFTAWYGLNLLHIIHVNVEQKTSMPLIAGLSSLKPGFDPWSLHLRFVMDKVALG